MILLKITEKGRAVNGSKISLERAQVSETRFIPKFFVTNPRTSYKPGLLVYFSPQVNPPN